MLRLLRFVPIVIPLIARFVKSPRGQQVIADVRRRIAGRGDQGPTPSR